MAKRPLRKTNRTVLIVVEGETEQAFVTHIKSLYFHRALRLTVHVKNAYGHGPQGVIRKLESVAHTATYDHRIAVLDADIPLKSGEQKWLRGAKIETIFSTPAIEATLLEILGKRAPDITPVCKRELQKHAPGDLTDNRYYQRHFPLDTLEQARGKVQVLDALIAAVSTE